jgi:hypothetical protein
MMGNVDVEIYINSVREFLRKNEGAAKYFFGNLGEDIFFELLTLFAYENFDQNGEPSLSIEQFEEIRHAVIAKFGSTSVSDIMHTLPFSLN